MFLDHRAIILLLLDVHTRAGQNECEPGFLHYYDYSIVSWIWFATKGEREFAYHTDNTNTGIPFHNYDYRKIITHVHCFTT